MQIYKITNLINSKLYIGKDTTSSKNYYGSGKLITRALKKYGKENFLKEILEECSSNEELVEREKFWIKKYNSQDLNIGYNISPGGDGGDTRSNDPNKKEVIEKISKSLKGRVFSEEHKKKLRENHNSKNPEVAKKISQKLKGRVFSEEHREKLRQANLGKKKSIEAIEKNRSALKDSRWIHNPLTGEQKRISKSKPTPEGWASGRNLGFRKQKSESQKGVGYKYYHNPEKTKQKRVKNNQDPPKGWLEGRAFEVRSTPTVKIEQYGIAGELLNTFLGYKSAEKLTGVRAINITNCCLGNQKSAGGYIWKKV